MSELEGKTHSRREVVKLGGMASLGLMYTKPSVSTVLAKPAFAGYGNDAKNIGKKKGKKKGKKDK